MKANRRNSEWLNTRTGEDQPGPIRLPDTYDVFASPVAAAGRVYVTSRNGVTLVLQDGDNPEVMARNRLDDSFNASPALAGREFFLRGAQSLYCLAEK
jgi:hypothetical protein